MQVIDIVLIAVFAYSVVGLAFSLYFSLVAANKIDPHTKGASKGFWVLIYPGCILLWPVFLSKIIKKR
jgi:hypothetical protein